MNTSNNLDNPSLLALEKKENEFIQTLALFKEQEQKLQQDAQQGSFINKEQTLQKLQGLLASLEGILLDMKSMIKIPFDKGLANTQVSQITSTNLLHQSFNLDKASEIYNEAKSQFESLIGERDNTKINYNKNKSLFNFWFLLVILVIFIFILFFKGYNVFNNNLIYLLLALLFYLFFDIFKQKFLIIYNFIILIWNNIINFLRLFN